MRRGRPRVQETADDVVASVLAAAGPRVGSSAYSTREIAAMVGLSQTLVSRSVRRIRQGGAGEERREQWASVFSVSGHLRLMSVQEHDGVIRVEFSVGAGGRGCHKGGDEAGDPASDEAGDEAGDAVDDERADGAVRHRGTRGRAGVRFSRRAAALMAGLWVAGGAPGAQQVSQQVSQPASQSAYQPVWSSPAHSGIADREDGVHVLQARRGGPELPAFLAEVADCLAGCVVEEDMIPGALLRDVSLRAHRGLRGVSWHRDGGLSRRPDSDSESVPDASELPAEERVAIALRGEVADSGLRPGDRIRPGRLGARAGLGPGAVRGALTQLAARGLVEQRSPGHAVATIHGADVIDVYAARLQLGQVLLRGAADRPRHRLVPLHTSLDRLQRAHAVGVAVEVDQADLQFQRTVAEVSGLRQSAETFHELTLRVQMFIAVLQLDYGPVADRILADDRRLLAALTQGRGDDAARIWRAKLDHAVRHMCAIAPERFDAALWSRLSGR